MNRLIAARAPTGHFLSNPTTIADWTQPDFRLSQADFAGLIPKGPPPDGLHEFDKGWNTEMTVKISGSAARHDYEVDVGIAREFLQALC
jgi:hypothetical protein